MIRREIQGPFHASHCPEFSSEYATFPFHGAPAEAAAPEKRGNPDTLLRR